MIYISLYRGNSHTEKAQSCFCSMICAHDASGALDPFQTIKTPIPQRNRGEYVSYRHQGNRLAAQENGVLIHACVPGTKNLIALPSLSLSLFLFHQLHTRFFQFGYQLSRMEQTTGSIVSTNAFTTDKQTRYTSTRRVKVQLLSNG